MLTTLLFGAFGYLMIADATPDYFRIFFSALLLLLFFADVIFRKKNTQSDVIFSRIWILWYLSQLFIEHELFLNGIPFSPDDFVFWMGIILYVLPLFVNILQLILIKRK